MPGRRAARGGNRKRRVITLQRRLEMKMLIQKVLQHESPKKDRMKKKRNLALWENSNIVLDRHRGEDNRGIECQSSSNL